MIETSAAVSTSAFPGVFISFKSSLNNEDIPNCPLVSDRNIQIGSKFYKTEFDVAPIVDDMLLGLNCIFAYNVTVDMGRSKFIIGGNEFHLNSDINFIIPVVARVSIPQGVSLLIVNERYVVFAKHNLG
jgi:hypothetical protein